MSTRTQRLIANIGFDPQRTRECTLRRMLQSLGYDGLGIHMIFSRQRARFVGPQCVYVTERDGSTRTIRVVAATV